MNLPQDFIDRTKPIVGNDFDHFVEAFTSDVPVSFRVNAKKFQGKVDCPQVPWCSTGHYLPARPLFTLDPLIHSGAYYVQEASSMFLEQAIKQHVSGDVMAFDLCAAPGGKSTHLVSLLSDKSFVVSNEYVRSRSYILSENLQKWGSPNTMACNNKPADYSDFSSLFDVVLVDAPCSGEGMFRKDAGAIDEWSVSNVKVCVARQEEILTDIWPSLKTGGVLVYSTCTYNREENEERVNWTKEHLGAELLDVQFDEAWGVTKSDAGYRFYPHKTKGEGFFMAVLRKTADEAVMRIKPEKKKGKQNKETFDYSKYIKNSSEYAFAELNGKMSLYPQQYAERIQYLVKNLNVLHAGITLGEVKGKNFIPNTALALSNELNRENCVEADVDLQTALSFLKTENIVLPEVAKGLVLITYKNHPLGWVKNLGNRCNSLYPSEWRIRMNLPVELPEVNVL